MPHKALIESRKRKKEYWSVNNTE